MCWRWTFDDIHLEQRLEAVERTLFEEYAKMNEKDSVTTKGTIFMRTKMTLQVVLEPPPHMLFVLVRRL